MVLLLFLRYQPEPTLVSLDICSNFLMIDLGVMTESTASNPFLLLPELLVMFSNLDLTFLTEPTDKDSGSCLSILGTFGHMALFEIFLFKIRWATLRISVLLSADEETGVSVILRFDGLALVCFPAVSLFEWLYWGDCLIIGAGDLLKFFGE